MAVDCLVTMGHGTMRVSASSQETLRRMAKAEGKSMLALLDEAVETLRRQRFLEQVNAAYAELRSDAPAWRAVEEERRAWDATLADGLTVAEGKGRYAGRRRGGRARKGR